MNSIKRVFVEKKKGCRVEAKHLLEDLQHNLAITQLINVRILNRYDVDNISEEAYQQAKYTIFSEKTVDILYEEKFELGKDEVVFGIEYLPGQYDQRADSCEQCIKLLNAKEAPIVRTAKIIVLKGKLNNQQIDKIKKYCINPVDSRETHLNKPITLELSYISPEDVEILEGFIDLNEEGIHKLWQDLGLAMTIRDLKFTQDYFKNEENRNPSLTEIRVLDTYWSDHCRHTTFLTKINKVDFMKGHYNEPVKVTYDKYLKDRVVALGDKADEKDICLMDMALLAMKKLRKEGKLDDLEVSDEINACSIIVDVDVDGIDEEWLVMFKNETHNHPTEIEPFGGAATCLGGAIRDPLSGRSYVYQAMRVTGAADPTVSIEETLQGKLSQRKIVTESAHGYSSYGNQIGLATGQVREIYHPNYVAKRMEIGAVIAATRRENVIRETSDPGDYIVLLGGRTGRDGCGGATGSSKEHTEESIHTCGAEVQKGNPPTERKIQRLFRQEKVSKLIKKCNDFGAGGVSVAIGELADGLIIDLDVVPKKYAGLDGTELAISESQERMAVVIDEKDVEKFIKYVDDENLEAVVVARVTDEKRLVMKWKGKTIVDISRGFLDTNGATDETEVLVEAPSETSYFRTVFDEASSNTSIKEKWLLKMSDLNVCSQKGLIERFDSSIGASSVFMPFGGKHQLTPMETMVAKIPLEKGDTTTGTAMSYGYNPYLSSWSPFHGAVYAIVESVSKIVATGGDYTKIRFTFQEYFKRLNKDASRWGEPFSALLGAYYAQDQLELPSIGGKDSMSGTFHEIDVPPTLVSFAVDVVDVTKVISPEFKQIQSTVVCIPLGRDNYELPDFKMLKNNYTRIHQLINEGKVLAAHTIGIGGLCEVISKMAFGNMIGIDINKTIFEQNFFAADYGSIVLEFEQGTDIDQLLDDIEYFEVGNTKRDAIISYGDTIIELDDALIKWQGRLEAVFPTQVKAETKDVLDREYEAKEIYVCKNKIAVPKVFIPVFPGTNCEYDSKKAFEEAGAEVTTFVFKNLKAEHIEESVFQMTRLIHEANIVMLPGGFSAGDEPDGSGKFIATAFRNERIKEAISELLHNRDGLMLGICNGFQALIKLGLVPYGDIIDIHEEAPTLTYNTIGRHISCIARTKIMSNKSPWLANVQVSDVFSIPVSHGEGRFLASKEVVDKLFENGQIATTYVDMKSKPSMKIEHNPNGSVYAIEGITSPDGRVLGKMGHSERIGSNVYKNIRGEKDQKIFKSGIEYFK
ncbi:MAG: phosphoribosylformylglycinamidine synthase [Firmicutes bacterium HGW-Firmicutes-1]|jgi:phosphoribosylformylglycinamidine synthase|nr:MAG: phosphoribosylformylglycinamidine synthase [Firmicutes bacterium HGW-Firmicutes-1]